MSHTSAWRPSTLAIHGNRTRETGANSILFPIHQTATFVHETVGVTKGHGYSRGSNPTVSALEQAIAALEGTPGSVVFRSGMAAATTLFLSLLRAGDHVILSDVIYGGTVRLFERVLGNFGIEYSFRDTSTPDFVRTAIQPNTKLIFLETPSNPTLKLADIAGVSEIARQHGLLVVVDNTFLTPLLQKPLQLGAHISLLSTTKYVDGHNATIGGSLATNDEDLLERFRMIRKTLGTIQAPLDSWLTLQGLKTLPTRIEVHNRNALKLARWLESHPLIERVYYPGLDSFAQKKLALRQQSGPGGMLAFELAASTEDSLRFIDGLKVATCAESLGSLETLITNPATASHCDLPPQRRAQLGISDKLIRVSVGLEAPEDLIADFEQSIAAVVGGVR